MKTFSSLFLALVSSFLFSSEFGVRADGQAGKTAYGDRLLAAYFKAETAKLSGRCLTDVHTLSDWTSHREQYRRQLLEMLGLSPFPKRTPLHPVVTGKLDGGDFTVENLEFQSMPGLYVTGNLYLPKGLHHPAPAILYACGHAAVVKNGVSDGNKTYYQHHGEWFARNGYVCLTIDSIQLGEIHGIHHGTYKRGMWWWNSRGYTPAGVEAWNCIRALDYLETRPEVDPKRLGMTGRSGGGASTWWTAAIDPRIKVVAPVAGMTDLENYVVDGTVEGHCDCMFMVNTYRWDYPQVAALIAPRPLLLCNSDKDTIFPLDGVYRLQAKLRHLYHLYGADQDFGLVITPGPHHDTQDLQLPVFRWFNHYLKGQDPVIAMAATPFFKPEQLKVFNQIPKDERTSTIHETFVPKAKTPPPPVAESDWGAQCNRWRRALLEKCFRGWPKHPGHLHLRKIGAAEKSGLRLAVYEFTSQPGIPLRLYILAPKDLHAAKRALLRIVTEDQWQNSLRRLASAFPKLLGRECEPALHPSADGAANPAKLGRLRDRLAASGRIEILFTPRGIGLTAWDGDQRHRTQIRRRFMLLGQTLAGMRVWDIRRAVQAVRRLPRTRSLPLTLRARDSMAANVLYASLFERPVKQLRLRDLPASHRVGPDYLNVLRYLDIPETVAMAAARVPVLLLASDVKDWAYPLGVAGDLHWSRARLQVEQRSGLN